MAALAALMCSCGHSPSKNEGNLDAETFEKMVRDSKDKIVLDVRTPVEFAQGHIPACRADRRKQC